MCLGRGRKVKREGSKPGQMKSELTKYLQTRDKARVQTSVKPVKIKIKSMSESKQYFVWLLLFRVAGTQ